MKSKINENSEFNFTQTSRVRAVSCFHIFTISIGSERKHVMVDLWERGLGGHLYLDQN